MYNSFSLGQKVAYDTMPFGFENHLIFGSVNFRQDHMEKAIEMLSRSRYDQIVALTDLPMPVSHIIPGKGLLQGGGRAERPSAGGGPSFMSDIPELNLDARAKGEIGVIDIPAVELAVAGGEDRLGVDAAVRDAEGVFLREQPPAGAVLGVLCPAHEGRACR